MNGLIESIRTALRYYTSHVNFAIFKANYTWVNRHLNPIGYVNEELVRGVLREKRGQELKIASLGCSYGAELVTLVGLCLSEGVQVHCIDGYDLNRDAIRIAKEVIRSPELLLTSTPQELEERKHTMMCLNFIGNETGQNALERMMHDLPLKETLEQKASVYWHSLATEPLKRDDYDLIVAFNVLRYFGHGSLRNAIQYAGNAQKTGGILLVDEYSMASDGRFEEGIHSRSPSAFFRAYHDVLVREVKKNYECVVTSIYPQFLNHLPQTGTELREHFPEKPSLVYFRKK